MEQFYIDLVSNASMDIFPKNSLSKFTNKLESHIELKGDWEVALKEIFYPTDIVGNERSTTFQIGDYSKIFATYTINYRDGEAIDLIVNKVKDKVQHFIKNYKGDEQIQFDKLGLRLKNGKVTI